MLVVAPPIRANNRPRAETNGSTWSMSMTPDRHAAAYSPRLWPSIALGVNPHAAS
ncbi:Uncharacterised protein [Mycobacteroides abscessus subsp. massiliense]|nr:Uncharacterised protein [Mycobacteroides abscessus subsp. massiliense]